MTSSPTRADPHGTRASLEVWEASGSPSRPVPEEGEGQAPAHLRGAREGQGGRAQAAGAPEATRPLPESYFLTGPRKGAGPVPAQGPSVIPRPQGPGTPLPPAGPHDLCCPRMARRRAESAGEGARGAGPCPKAPRAPGTRRRAPAPTRPAPRTPGTPTAPGGGGERPRWPPPAGPPCPRARPHPGSGPDLPKLLPRPGPGPGAAPARRDGGGRPPSLPSAEADRALAPKPICLAATA